MERINDRLTELASTFEDIDLEVIEGVLDMCQNDVDKAAEILLKMQEDASAQEREPEGEDRKESRSNPLEARHRREPVQEAEIEIENEIEKEYMKHIQKAIERSLQDKQKAPARRGDEKQSEEMRQAIKLSLIESREKEKEIEKQKEKEKKRRSSSPKFGEKLKNIFRKKSEHKDERTKKHDEEVIEIIKPNPNEEIIQFVFRENVLIRGERSF